MILFWIKNSNSLNSTFYYKYKSNLVFDLTSNMGMCWTAYDPTIETRQSMHIDHQTRRLTQHVNFDLNGIQQCLRLVGQLSRWIGLLRVYPLGHKIPHSHLQIRLLGNNSKSLPNHLCVEPGDAVERLYILSDLQNTRLRNLAASLVLTMINPSRYYHLQAVPSWRKDGVTWAG